MSHRAKVVTLRDEIRKTAELRDAAGDFIASTVFENYALKLDSILAEWPEKPVDLHALAAELEALDVTEWMMREQRVAAIRAVLEQAL